ncbi:Protein of unknown function [Paenibacillus sp. UNCCL117]|uniref:DUF2953 domain-containing protein n=1 Tax=unclassified Paenibacillus TaxID=185978 RepID=UPI000885397B|nr:MULTISPECIES: DUF2953 domain-containing protein [unclassified Paenibacillus]SDC38804.1 Protein of unknown function [Paenibacillus sp. cl123]SFW14322.1 Protein of unknown function [Paenibacillus sp. UNCCL117]
MIWLGVAAVLVFLAGLLLSRPVKIRFAFTHQEQNDEITIEVKALLGLVHFRYEVPVIRFKGLALGLEVRTEQVNANAGTLLGDHDDRIDSHKIKSAYEDFRELLEHCFEFNEWMKRLMSRVHCTELSWKTSVGLGDAPATAMLVGSLWAIKSSMLGFISRSIRLDAQPQLMVMPAFNRKAFLTEGTGMFYIRIWHLLSGGVRLLHRIRKTEGGWDTWKRILARRMPQPQ